LHGIEQPQGISLTETVVEVAGAAETAGFAVGLDAIGVALTDAEVTGFADPATETAEALGVAEATGLELTEVLFCEAAPQPIIAIMRDP